MATFALAWLLLAGCAGDETPTDAPAAEHADPTSADSEGANTSAEPTDGPDATTTTAASDERLTVSTEPGLEPSRPIVSWPTVEGAVRYELLVWTESGELYWAWQGTETTIPIGGSPQLGPNSAGVALSPGMVWLVTAIGGDGFILAQSSPEWVS